MTHRKPDQHVRDVAIVLNNHQLTGGTRFSHRNGESVVEHPECTCGQWSGQASWHAWHQADALASAGLIPTPQEA